MLRLFKVLRCLCYIILIILLVVDIVFKFHGRLAIPMVLVNVGITSYLSHRIAILMVEGETKRGIQNKSIGSEVRGIVTDNLNIEVSVKTSNEFSDSELVDKVLSNENTSKIIDDNIK